MRMSFIDVHEQRKRVQIVYDVWEEEKKKELAGCLRDRVGLNLGSRTIGNTTKFHRCCLRDQICSHLSIELVDTIQ